MLHSNMPRPEYPRPQMRREEWTNLNGSWNFQIDQAKSGRDRRFFKVDMKLKDKINVPFCPESKLSGVGFKDFMHVVWYQKKVDYKEEWKGRKVLLHFGAVDYATEVWVNGESVGTHKGGYSSFSFDISAKLKRGENVITVCAEDDNRSGKQPSGKQSQLHFSVACVYTRITGIWQTVWIESVPESYISSFKLVPDPENSAVHAEVKLVGTKKDHQLKVEAFYKGKLVGQEQVTVMNKVGRLTLKLSEIHLWQPGAPELYDLKMTLLDEHGVMGDTVDSYIGLRSIELDGMAFRINGKSVFQRLILDQGYYPDGLYTAPTDDDLRKDIEISMEMGYNGARLHEKIFEPRFLYWADKLGYLVWGEHANWGLDITSINAVRSFLPEWMEIMERDFNSPALIGWCPLNETLIKNGVQDDDLLRMMYEQTKAYDTTRPVIDTSGFIHVVTDIYDVHDYEQNVEKFREKYEPLKRGEKAVVINMINKVHHNGEPYFVSEYGGISYADTPLPENSWGYGNRAETLEDFYTRYEGLTNVLLDHPQMFGFCYTQLYDIEQERNGMYYYDRRPKFDNQILHRINSRKAAIED